MDTEACGGLYVAARAAVTSVSYAVWMESPISVRSVEVFFFSSRRRHTRLQGDWSSDVCSSDLGRASYYSGIFDFAGLAGAIIAGWALDRWFRGQWQILCFVMGIGMVLGYVLVVEIGRASCRERV